MKVSAHLAVRIIESNGKRMPSNAIYHGKQLNSGTTALFSCIWSIRNGSISAFKSRESQFPSNRAIRGARSSLYGCMLSFGVILQWEKPWSILELGWSCTTRIKLEWTTKQQRCGQPTVISVRTLGQRCGRRERKWGFVLHSSSCTLLYRSAGEVNSNYLIANSTSVPLHCSTFCRHHRTYEQWMLCHKD